MNDNKIEELTLDKKAPSIDAKIEIDEKKIDNNIESSFHNVEKEIENIQGSLDIIEKVSDKENAKKNAVIEKSIAALEYNGSNKREITNKEKPTLEYVIRQYYRFLANNPDLVQIFMLIFSSSIFGMSCILLLVAFSVFVFSILFISLAGIIAITIWKIYTPPGVIAMKCIMQAKKKVDSWGKTLIERQ